MHCVQKFSDFLLAHSDSENWVSSQDLVESDLTLLLLRARQSGDWRSRKKRPQGCEDSALGYRMYIARCARG